MSATTLGDRSAEARIISAVADTPDLFRHAAHLAPDDFYDQEARGAWAKLRDAIRGGRAVYVSDYTRWHSEAGEVVPLPEFVAEDVRRILSASLARRAITAASDIAKAAYTLDEPAILDALKKAAELSAGRSLDTLRPISEAILELRAELDDPDAATRSMVRTGIPPLDLAFGGGFERGTLTILMARPSMGKTSLLAQISDTASEKKQTVAVFSKEETRRQWARRISFRRAGVSILEYKQGKTPDDKLPALLQELDNVYDRAALYVDASTPQTTDGIFAECERLKAQSGLDLVIVDHLRHLADKADNETHRMGRISWALKMLAKRLDCAVIAAAQLSRAVEGQGDKRPDLKDLRDSGEIEENADNVIGLYRDAYYNPQSSDITAELLVRKAREGARNAELKMGFIESTMAFVKLQREHVA